MLEEDARAARLERAHEHFERINTAHEHVSVALNDMRQVYQAVTKG